jgi:hypothetical protein
VLNHSCALKTSVSHLTHELYGSSYCRFAGFCLELLLRGTPEFLLDQNGCLGGIVGVGSTGAATLRS